MPGWLSDHYKIFTHARRVQLSCHEQNMQHFFLLFEQQKNDISNQLNTSCGSEGRQWTGSTLIQVMACCLMAPSQNLKQCWLVISKVQGQSPEDNFTRDTSASTYINRLENYLETIPSKSPMGNNLIAPENRWSHGSVVKLVPHLSLSTWKHSPLRPDWETLQAYFAKCQDIPHQIYTEMYIIWRLTFVGIMGIVFLEDYEIYINICVCVFMNPLTVLQFHQPSPSQALHFIPIFSFSYQQQIQYQFLDGEMQDYSDGPSIKNKIVSWCFKLGF